MTAVEAVLFDLDGTLLEYERSVPEVLAAAFERAGAEPFFEAAAYYERFDDYVEAADSMADLRAACFADIARDRGRDPELGRAVAEAYTAERDQTNVRPLPGAVETVEALARDHRLGLVTNGTREMQRTKLAAVGLTDAFEAEVFAGEGVPAKPDPAPFERALDALGTDPDRTVHVGDSHATDVVGAHAIGLHTVWVGEDGRELDPEPHHVIGEPRELAPPPWRSR